MKNCRDSLLCMSFECNLFSLSLSAANFLLLLMNYSFASLTCDHWPIFLAPFMGFERVLAYNKQQETSSRHDT